MSAVLSRSDVDVAVAAVSARADAGDLDGAWASAASLREHQAGNTYAEMSLLYLVDRRAFAPERGAEVLEAIFRSLTVDDTILGLLGSALEGAHDVRFLNGRPPSTPFFAEVAERLRDRAAATRGTEQEPNLLVGLATAARLLGRSWDLDAERAYRRLVELRPERWQDQYNLGLFFKVRGRFAEGQTANQRAAALGGEGDQSVVWNLGICATGARDAAAALAAWRGMGQKIEMGRFGLPEGGYGPVKVRLAEHPLAERRAGEDDPGLEETIWIERLSPCHGVVRSALFQDLGVDYGDAVLFDGAAVTHHAYGDQSVPVFPHLATLQRSGYRFWPFVGTQPAAGVIGALSKVLPDDTVLYSHSEQFVVMCAHCWDSRGVDHTGHRQAEHHVVRGKLCAPPGIAPSAVRLALDSAVAASDGVRVFVPELSRLLGDHARAEVESRRAAMIEGTPSPGGP